VGSSQCREDPRGLGEVGEFHRLVRVVAAVLVADEQHCRRHAGVVEGKRIVPSA
jgi:hypothetical protein